MTLIFYEEAAEMLGVTIGTLKEALKPRRKAFTRVPRMGLKGQLIKEQVLLYKGINPRTGKKKRLTLESLTPEERELWHKYEQEFYNPQPAQPATKQQAPQQSIIFILQASPDAVEKLIASTQPIMTTAQGMAVRGYL